MADTLKNNFDIKVFFNAFLNKLTTFFMKIIDTLEKIFFPQLILRQFVLAGLLLMCRIIITFVSQLP